MFGDEREEEESCEKRSLSRRLKAAALCEVLLTGQDSFTLT